STRRRRTERDRDCGRRSHLPHQRQLHARGAFSSHGAAPRCILCAACQVGSAPQAAQRAGGAPLRRSGMKAVLLGATSGIGRELARQLAERGDAIFLLGRDAADLSRSAADLRARMPNDNEIGHALCDLERPEQFGPALDAADAALGGFDTVIVTAAMFATQDALEDDVDLARRLCTVNFANTIAFCEHARKRLLARGGGQLTVLSS